jgi:Mlc titration factor MtfA (ptsG expression regulator)
MGVADWIEGLRREMAIARAGISDAEWEEALARHPAAAKTGSLALPAGRHRALAAQFMGEKQFLSPPGFGLSREILISVSLNAVLPCLGGGAHLWRGWRSIFILPDTFTETSAGQDGAGVVEEIDEELSGQARELGPVLLSWPDVLDSGRGRGYNLPVHEMAHKIDGLDGEIDGTPPLEGAARMAFMAARDAALADFRARASRSTHRRRGMSASRLPMDDYAAEDEAEFFAVSVEAFFDRPAALQRAYPDWYAALAACFGVDTAGA